MIDWVVNIIIAAFIIGVAVALWNWSKEILDRTFKDDET